MKTFFSAIDSIIEDDKKTKAVIRWMQERGMLDETAIAFYEIDQANKEAIKCTHKNPDGSDATFDAVGITSCKICGADDYEI